MKKDEEKVTTKNYSIEKQDQKRLKGISKFFYIVAKIVKVFAIIGIVGMFIAMLCVPIITTNIKATKGEDIGTLKVFDNEFYYKRDEKNFEFYEKDKIEDKTVISSQRDIDALNKVFDYLEDNDLVKLTIFAEIEFVLIAVVLFIEFKIFKKVHDFFKNLHDESTPFIAENIELLKEIGKLLIVGVIVGFIIGVISTLVVGTSLFVSTTGILEILAVFVAMYIFKYGYKIQKDTKGKIYSE